MLKQAKGFTQLVATLKQPARVYLVTGYLLTDFTYLLAECLTLPLLCLHVHYNLENKMHKIEILQLFFFLTSMWTYLLQNVQYRKQVYYKPGKRFGLPACVCTFQLRKFASRGNEGVNRLQKFQNYATCLFLGVFNTDCISPHFASLCRLPIDR